MFLLLCPFFLVAQEVVVDKYRSYNVEVALEKDSVTFEYEVLFSATDSTPTSLYTTSSLDTFVFLLKEDLRVMPETKCQLFFYLHGMMGGQKMNFRMTKEDLRDRYITPENSDLSRLISFRWPGNKPIYQVDKDNVFLVAEEMSLKMQEIIESVRAENEEGNKEIGFDIMNHSLGCELFKEMVSYLKEDKKYFDQILLCAPDLDVDVFIEDGSLYDLYKYANRVTVYHSRKDLTLGFSRQLNDRGRLGIDGPDVDSHFHPSYVFVDMTAVNDEKFFPMKLTGHAYYRGSDLASADMLATLIGTSAELIALRKRSFEQEGKHFVLVPDQE